MGFSYCGAARAMRVPADQARPEDDPTFPWMGLAAAVRWALWRGNEPLGGELHGDYDGLDPPMLSTAGDVRLALASGRLSAIGFRGYVGSEHEDIAPVEWSVRPVSPVWSEIGQEPYKRILVKRSQVMGLWPTAPNRRGATRRHDHVAIQELANTIRGEGISRKLAEEVRARWPKSKAVPSVATIKRALAHKSEQNR